MTPESTPENPRTEFLFADEEDRQLLMHALEGVELTWNLRNGAKIFRTQTRVLAMYDAIKFAKIVGQE